MPKDLPGHEVVPCSDNAVLGFSKFQKSIRFHLHTKWKDNQGTLLDDRVGVLSLLTKLTSSRNLAAFKNLPRAKFGSDSWELGHGIGSLHMGYLQDPQLEFNAVVPVRRHGSTLNIVREKFKDNHMYQKMTVTVVRLGDHKDWWLTGLTS